MNTPRARWAGGAFFAVLGVFACFMLFAACDDRSNGEVVYTPRYTMHLYDANGNETKRLDVYDFSPNDNFTRITMPDQTSLFIRDIPYFAERYKPKAEQ